MKTVVREMAGAAAFAVVGVAVSLAVALPQRAEANPDPGVSYVWRGMSPSGQYCYPWGQFTGWHPCWHDDESAGEYTAIDFSFYYPGDCTGEAVWLDYTGDFQRFKMADYEHYCTGVRAKLYEKSYNEQDYVGDINYLHTDKNEFWIGQEVPYQTIYIGDILASDNPGCSTAPHLHQSADISSGTPFYTNKLGDATEDNEWVHAIMWEPDTGDEDGDVWVDYVWTNETELYIGTDPFDGCPDSSSDAAWPPDIDNSAWVNTGDVLQYRGRIPKNVGDPAYLRRLDLNTDGSVNIGDILMYKGRLLPRCSN